MPEICLNSDQDDVDFLQSYLCKAGDKRNESATDCANMVFELGAVVDRLLLHTPMQSNSNILGGDQMKVVTQSPGPLLSISADRSAFGSIPALSADMDLGIQGNADLAPVQELYAWFDNTFY